MKTLRAVMLCLALLCGSAFGETYVQGFGINSRGQLGNGEISSTFSARVSTVNGIGGIRSRLTGIRQVLATTLGTTWFVTEDNKLFVCGLFIDRNVAGPELFMENVLSISGAGRYWSIIKVDGTVWTMTWGFTYQALTQVLKEDNQPLMNMVVASTGAYHAVGIDNIGKIWSWGQGSNTYGELGDGTTTSRTKARNILSDKTFVSVSACERTSLAVASDGTVWGFGANSEGQLGIGTHDNGAFMPHHPIQMLDNAGAAPLTGVFKVALDWSMAVCLRAADYAVVGFAYRSLVEGGVTYQFGDDNLIGSVLPRVVPWGFSDIRTFANTAGGGCYFGKKDGKWYFWGTTRGKWCTVYTDKARIPTLIPGSEEIIDISWSEYGNFYCLYVVDDPSTGAGVSIPGPKGDKGDAGPQGIAGAEGPQGFKGDKGDLGDAGPQGLQGIQGPQGLDGLKGDKGDLGDTGSEGPPGLQGLQGPKGDKGDKGDTGQRGPAGGEGSNGLNGLSGTPGPTGPSMSVPAGTIIQLEESVIPPDGYTYVGYTFIRIVGEKKRGRFKLMFYKKD